MFSEAKNLKRRNVEEEEEEEETFKT